MTASADCVVGASPEDVFAWHARPGAMARLVPPWLPLKAGAQAADLGSGCSELVAARVWRLKAEHLAGLYDPPRSFAEDIKPFGIRSLGWRHTHTFEPLGGQRTSVSDRVSSRLPGCLFGQVISYGHRQLAGDLEAHAWASRLQGGPLTVAVTGSSGTIGTALVDFLTSGGHSVVRLVRRTPKSPSERQWDIEHPSPDLLDGVDAVVHLAGVPIYGRFTQAHKAALYNSRVGPTRLLAEVAASANARGAGPSCFVSASAVGFYGPDRGDEVLTEQSGRGEGLLADLCERWEQAAQPAEDAGLRVVKVRTGIVQTPSGGMLQVLRPLFFAGLGGRLGDGRQWVPWVGIDDALDVYLRALADPAVAGPVNCVSPGTVTNREYTAILASVLKRPSLLSVPRWAAVAALRGDGAREFAFAGQRVKPSALEAVGHRWRHPELGVALRHVLGRWAG